ncbi:F0F1 ATP synthase subunit A [Candidatus Vampirococcus lugosii]|uniref:FoF1-type ATP synthase, membrane subunit a n=1 Tax=Candidatus Vampirococcus lugosii TaxID=2789015 RepID=A0ABS5QKL5_9BACT|nr:F0F1 ATP synthase subunit A [Candidatus Vampirococcus lugosii]MBS8121780.1 FoF1-type ATP synthase, membrane subunit a [Candidatus Vampirococcus lugosii]
MESVFEAFLSFYLNPGFFYGTVLVVLLILFISIFYRLFPNSGFSILFDYFFEKMYDFFEDILGNEEKKWIKTYVVILFFVILISNLLGVFLEILVPVFGNIADTDVSLLKKYIDIPTADINFNIAMALIGLLIIIFEQFRALGFGKALYEYFPIFGKNYLPYTRGNLNPIFDWPLFILVKIFDLIISLFLGLLEIVGHFAKVISLSFRLFGNVTSGGMLLAMLVGAISGLTLTYLNFEFPVLGPVILYFQSLLVALIQALVFPLLIAIFIKVAKFA